LLNSDVEAQPAVGLILLMEESKGIANTLPRSLKHPSGPACSLSLSLLKFGEWYFLKSPNSHLGKSCLL